MFKDSQNISKLLIVLVLMMLTSLFMIGCPFGGDDDDDNGSLTDPSETTPTPLPAGTMILETFSDGQTSGEVIDGTFTSEGIQFHGGWWSLRYVIPRTPRGYIEFDASNLIQDELHGGSEFKSLLLSMWDAEGGYDYDFSRYIYELRKFGAIIGHPSANAIDLRFKVDPNDWNHGDRRPVLSWDRDKTYRFRVEWDNDRTTVFRDGEVILSVGFRGQFAPGTHIIQLGANVDNPFRHRWKEAPHDTLISYVRIGTL
jgi:hypothetical protein